MFEFPNTSHQLAALADLDASLRHHGISYWLFGGWAVDFHAGRVSREHGDLDLAVWADDRERVAELLAGHGWVHRAEVGEDGYTRYERGVVQLDLAFLARDEGGRVYTPLRGGRGEWPDRSFEDEVAELRGVRVHVVGRGSLLADKSAVRADPLVAAKDRADVATLAGA